jgi:hypothetical protein
MSGEPTKMRSKNIRSRSRWIGAGSQPQVVQEVNSLLAGVRSQKHLPG